MNPDGVVRRVTGVVAEGERIVLVPLTAAHLPYLEAWDADPEVTRFTGRRFAEVDPARWLAELQASDRRLGFAVCLRDGGVIGDLQLEDIDPEAGSAELRICIGRKDLWGRGLGREAVTMACRLAFERLGLRSVYLRVPLGHQRAIRCYSGCGFRKQGILRAGRRRRQGAVDHLLMVLDAADPDWPLPWVAGDPAPGARR